MMNYGHLQKSHIPSLEKMILFSGVSLAGIFTAFVAGVVSIGTGSLLSFGVFFLVLYVDRKRVKLYLSGCPVSLSETAFKIRSKLGVIGEFIVPLNNVRYRNVKD